MGSRSQQRDERGGRSNFVTFLRHSPAVLVLLLIAMYWPTPAQANASIFVNSSVASCVYSFCTAASQFGILIGPNDALGITGTTNILNDIGVAAGGSVNGSGTVNIGATGAGNARLIDYADTFTPSGNVPCNDDTGGTKCNVPAGAFSAGTKVWGGTASNPTLVNQAYTQFQDLVTYWNGQTASGSAVTSGTWTITSGATTVISTSNYNPSGAVTIGCGVAVQCAANTLLIVKVTNTSTVDENIQFLAASGLRDDQVLFIINNGGNTANALTIGANAARIVHGTFFVPDGGFTLGNTGVSSTTDFYGRIFANAISGGDTITKGVTVRDQEAVPEPGTWALMGGGLAAMIYAARRRKRAA